MDCQAITLGEHLLWEAVFKSFGYKNGRPLGAPIFIGWVKAVAPTPQWGGKVSVMTFIS
jgi:hypothetical protein